MADAQATIAVVVALGVLGTLLVTDAAADVVLFAGVGILVITGVLDVQTALGGFANEGVFTVGLLFVVAAGLRQTGAVHRLAGPLLGRPDRQWAALARLTLPVAAASGILNNTPIVATLLPVVTDWSRRHGQAASRFLIPLSYATILGGTVTVIGTSTNLVVAGLVERNVGATPGLVPIGIFDITPIGVPVAIVGCALLILAAPWLLPDRRPPVSTADDPREYAAEFLVQARGPLVGKPIEVLHHLPGAFLLELHREGDVLPVVEPHLQLREGDRLVFAAPREVVVDLKRIPGLVQAPNHVFALTGQHLERTLVEAVVGPANLVLGRTIREGRFRSVYNAVVIGIARDGQRIGGSLGDVALEIGDVLLLESTPQWAEIWRDSRDFYLVSDVPDSSSFRHHRAGLAAVILAGMVGIAASGLAGMFEAALVGAGAMLATGCLSASDARRAVEWPVLVAIASAFGLGEAFRITGVDVVIAEGVVGMGATTPVAGMIAIYVVTALLTEMITNNAAAALMFPFALSLSAQLGCSPMPYCVAVMFAASASFSTPIGYQTNLMVQGPGGYRFADYLRAGIPLQIVAGIVTLVLVPIFFPF